MKRLLFLLGLFSLTNLAAQKIDYKTIKDDAADVSNLVVALDLLQFDVPMPNFEGMSVNLGLWGMANYKNKLFPEFAVRKGILTLGRLAGGKEVPHNFNLELGGSFIFKTKNKIKSFKVVLDVKETTNKNGDAVKITKFIKVPGHQNSYTGLHGGLYMRQNAIAAVEDADGSNIGNMPDYVGFSTHGVFVGLIKYRTANLEISTKEYNTKGGGMLNSLFVDALILPISTVRREGVSYRDNYSKNPIGARFGYRMYAAQPRKQTKGKGKGMMTQLEIGYRPLDGAYFNGSIAVSLASRKSTKLGYVKPASEERTIE